MYYVKRAQNTLFFGKIVAQTVAQIIVRLAGGINFGVCGFYFVFSEPSLATSLSKNSMLFLI